MLIQTVSPSVCSVCLSDTRPVPCPRQVTGYVLIASVDVPRLVLPSLQIIRGRTLFKLNVWDEEFSLMVTMSKMYSLEMPALRGKATDQVVVSWDESHFL